MDAQHLAVLRMYDHLDQAPRLLDRLRLWEARNFDGPTGAGAEAPHLLFFRKTDGRDLRVGEDSCRHGVVVNRLAGAFESIRSGNGPLFGGKRLQEHPADDVAGGVNAPRLAKGLRSLSVPLDDVASILAIAHDGTCGEVRPRLTATLEGALETIERQIDELLRARQQVSIILTGLASMRAHDALVPSLQPCGCVALVSRHG